MFTSLHALFIYTLLLSLLSVLASDIHNAHYTEHRSLSRRAHGGRTLNSTSVAPLPTSSTTSPASKSNLSEPISSLASNSSTADNALNTSPNTNFTASQLSPSPNVTTTLPKPGSATLDDFQIIAERRIVNIINALGNGSDIAEWLSTLGSDGKWPDSEIDYTTGCTARRANWPAQVHWERIAIMSGAWHGGLPGTEQYIQDATLRAAISLAMDYWFDNDFTVPGCLDSGGTSSCPCGTPGFWNTNWFSNIILIPEYVGQSCLLLNGTLSTRDLEGCSLMTLRSFGTFGRFINGIGFLTGANTLDVAKIGLDQGLLTQNQSLVTDAYGRVHAEVVIQQTTTADGIRPDGSFGQHSGILYNGNYGKDYANDDLDLETEAAGTQFEADEGSKNALITLFDGDQWMIYRNVLTGVLHWDFSALGRFISFPVADNQATGSINTNLTKVRVLGGNWQSDKLIDIVDSLNQNTTDANVGSLDGNRMFWDNDYMVNRGPGYVSTLKMFSIRTQNTECNNSQNLLGFHLSDGTLYTYLQGNEYEDIPAAWDWNLIPGTTTDYAATPFICANFTGIESFVGGASDGQIGVAAMRYTNPYTRTLSWQKTWFFFEDVQYVMVSKLRSATSAPVYSVLDQRRHNGNIFVDGQAVTQSSNFTVFNTLWHGSVGYSFDSSPGYSGLSVEVGDKTGDWSTIGTSKQPPVTVDLFAAYLSHASLALGIPTSYSAFPATSSLDEFLQKKKRTKLKATQNDDHISAVYDENHHTLMIVFWDPAGGSTIAELFDAPLTITSNGNSAVIYQLDTGNVTVSDPTQTLTSLEIEMRAGLGKRPPHWGWKFTQRLSFELPTSGMAGSSVTKTISE